MDENSWLIDDKLLLRRRQAHETPESNYLWKDGEGWQYSIVDAPTPLPNATSCQQLHMDTSTFVFNHNPLGPTNVMFDVDDNCNIGIVGWEMGGFVPFAWVRTKLATCFAMDFCWKGVDVDDTSRSEWRRRVAKELGKHNVPDLSDEYQSWYKQSSST